MAEFLENFIKIKTLRLELAFGLGGSKGANYFA